MSDTTTPSAPTPEPTPGGTPPKPGSWLDADVDGRPVRAWILIGVAIAVVTLGVGTWWTYGLDRAAPMASQMSGQQADGSAMDDMAMSPEAPRVPPVFAYYDDQEIAFIHTEVSDAEIASVLEGMMGSPVPVVASLTEVPDTARGAVYVFTNGLVPQDTPAGPLGFQPDIFDSVPGDDGYTPLREIVPVRWVDETDARLVTSVADLETARDNGEVAFQAANVVVNAPLLTWPGGQR